MHIRPVPLALLLALAASGKAQAQVLPPRQLPHLALPSQIPVTPRGIDAPVLPPVGKPVPTLPLAALPYPVPGYQPSAMQVWQNYGWTYSGWMRPRVIQMGDMGYWYYNGAPFPYVYTLPGRHYSSTIAPAGAPGP